MYVCMYAVCESATRTSTLSLAGSPSLSLSVSRIHMHVGNCKWLEHVGFVVAFIPNYNKLPVLAQSPFLEF